MCDSVRVAPFFISMTPEDPLSDKAFQVFYRFLHGHGGDDPDQPDHNQRHDQL